MSEFYDRLREEGYYDELREMGDDLSEISYFADFKSEQTDNNFSYGMAIKAYLEFDRDIEKTRAFVDYLKEEYRKDSEGLVANLKESRLVHKDILRDVFDEFNRHYDELQDQERRESIEQSFENISARIRNSVISEAEFGFRKSLGTLKSLVSKVNEGVTTDRVQHDLEDHFATISNKLVSKTDTGRVLRRALHEKFWERVDHATVLTKSEVNAGVKRNADYAFIQKLRQDAARKSAKMFNRKTPNEQDWKFSKEFIQHIRSIQTTNKDVMVGAMKLTLIQYRYNHEKRLKQEEEAKLNDPKELARQARKEAMKQKRAEKKTEKTVEKKATKNKGRKNDGGLER